MWSMGTDKRIQKKDSGIWKKMLQEDYTNRMVSESNKQETLHRSAAHKKFTPASNTEKLRLFGQVQNEWQSKSNGQIADFWYYWRKKVGRLHAEWVDDIEDWCRASLQELRHFAQDKTKLNKIVKEASDSNGRWAQSWRWWWWWWRWWWWRWWQWVKNNTKLPLKGHPRSSKIINFVTNGKSVSNFL